MLRWNMGHLQRETRQETVYETIRGYTIHIIKS
jgi:hypothetical protein